MPTNFTDESTIEKAFSRLTENANKSLPTHSFSNDINKFDRWKTEIGKTLSKFRLWLRRNDLFNEDIDKRLFKLQESLKKENLTIAFVGEFSRGKTELINSLFFCLLKKGVLFDRNGN